MNSPRNSNYVYVPLSPETPTPIGAGGASFESVADTRSKNWPWTLPNFTEEHVGQLMLLAQTDNSINYMIFGREICPSTGTPHLQGFVQFKSKRSFLVVKCLLPWGTHIEKARESAFVNAQYCKKKDPHPFEFVNLS